MVTALDLDLVLTVAVIVGASVSGGLLIHRERRPPDPGKPRLLPSTPLLFLCALALVLALAHLVTIITGAPHTGRLGV